LAYGHQVIRVFTRKGAEVAEALRAAGLRVTAFAGEGRDGEVELLFIETQRRDVRGVLKQARQHDPSCYYIVEDIRMTSSADALFDPAGGWMKRLKRK
jgi:uncharacterized protein YebE (UPF0316 family)